MRIVELVGLPGAGKTTLEQRLWRSGKVAKLDPVLRLAAGRWFSDRGGRGWAAIRSMARITGERPLASRVFLHRFLSDNKACMREYYRSNPKLGEAIGSWLKRGIPDEVTDLRLFEHVGTMYIVAGRQYLLDRYAAETGLPVLIDEHWLQLLAFMFNWGPEEVWWSWMAEALQHIPLPSKVIWLEAADQVSQARQHRRDKIAPLFFGCSDIAAKGAQLEARFRRVCSALEKRGVDVIVVRADRPIDAVASDVIAAL